MLSADDEQRLAEIGQALSISDPVLAWRLRHLVSGWPVGGLTVVLVSYLAAVALLTVGATSGNSVAAVVGGLGTAAAAATARRRRRSQRDGGR